MIYFKKGDVMLRQNANGIISRCLCVEMLEESGVMLWARQDKKNTGIAWDGLFLTELGAHEFYGGYRTMNGVIFTFEENNQ